MSLYAFHLGEIISTVLICFNPTFFRIFKIQSFCKWSHFLTILVTGFGGFSSSSLGFVQNSCRRVRSSFEFDSPGFRFREVRVQVQFSKCAV